MNILQAIECFRDMAARWDKTTEWHNPPFHDGTIKIDTMDLHALSIIREILLREGALDDEATEMLRYKD